MDRGNTVFFFCKFPKYALIVAEAKFEPTNRVGRAFIENRKEREIMIVIVIRTQLSLLRRQMRETKLSELERKKERKKTRDDKRVISLLFLDPNQSLL